jgi:hypothetical protein
LPGMAIGPVAVADDDATVLVAVELVIVLVEFGGVYLQHVNASAWYMGSVTRL